MSCTCHSCKLQYKVDIILSDDLWERIKISDGENMLCGSCIMKRIEALDEYDAYKLMEISNDDIQNMDEELEKMWQRQFEPKSLIWTGTQKELEEFIKVLNNDEEMQ